jgi:pyridoxamine 5'-phosphate oxidase
MDNLREHINKLRKDFALQSLSEESVAKNPFVQFEKWFQEAMQSQIPEWNAFTLATASADGKPSNRIVYLRDFNANGFSFFTNYASCKGKDIADNPFVCMNFFWPQMERQVKIEGRVEKLLEEESQMYFHSRPRESQIGAWASKQSEVIPSRQHLEQLVEKYTRDFEGQEIPRPPYWGGYLIIPEKIEFWQGRPSRLHDRIRYVHIADSDWKTERLSP